MGGSAATKGRDTHSAAPKAAKMKPAMNECVRFIRPPSYEWAICGFACRSRQKPHLQLPARHKERPALRCLRPFRGCPQYAFQFLGTHSYALREKCGSWFAANGHSRKSVPEKAPPTPRRSLLPQLAPQ